MRGKNNNKKRSAPRRRRNTNGSTVARNQTKYHRQYVGFETTFALASGRGIVMPIAPGNYNPAGSVPTTAYSQYFNERFSRTWKAWRMLGWKCTMIVTTQADANSGYAGVVAAVPFNQSLDSYSNASGAILALKPNLLSQLCELPNIKMTSTNSANAKNRASFSYFQGRRDINSLPFQSTIDLPIPNQYVTGLQIYNEGQPTEDTVIIRIFGNMLIEFKDPAFYGPTGIEETITDDHDHHQNEHLALKRLQRVDLTKR